MGLVAGYVGGVVDDIIMFITNLFTVIPSFVLLILISFSIGQDKRGAVTVAVTLPDNPGYEHPYRNSQGELIQRSTSDVDSIRRFLADQATAVGRVVLLFLVNFTAYPATGLFLDYRLVRARIRELARGRRFLNLFAYTGSSTCYAAAGGAASTLSVDMSHTYLDWARRNLELNGLAGPTHAFVRADCLAWLSYDDGQRFDLVLLDPPTFSNSKSMEREFDVQRDHVGLVRATLSRLAPGGMLIFSTNLQRFRLDAAALGEVDVEDWSAATLPKDFARRPRIRSVFAIRPR